jgi:branched-chain amino acid transport system ATP-binding protein
MLLKLKNISFSYLPTKPILEDIDLTLKQGVIYALMGANGAGKSTLFNIISGFIMPKKGEIIFNQNSITNTKPFKRNTLGIGRTFQDLRLITTLTVKENIHLAFKNKLSDKWYNTLIPSKRLLEQERELEETTKKILNLFNLVNVQNNLAHEISYGQQKFLTIACCVANDAQLILLDEPVAGINPVFREQLTVILKDLKQQGKTILLIEHNSDFISQVADSILFLNNGKITQYPTIDEMKKDSNVINAYM